MSSFYDRLQQNVAAALRGREKGVKECVVYDLLGQVEQLEKELAHCEAQLHPAMLARRDELLRLVCIAEKP